MDVHRYILLRTLHAYILHGVHAPWGAAESDRVEFGGLRCRLEGLEVSRRSMF